MHRRAVFMFASIALTAAMLVGHERPANAAAIVVDSADDELNVDGDCSFREAVEAANTDTAVDACAAGNGADAIGFAAALDTVTVVGEVTITSPVTITGNGQTNTLLQTDIVVDLGGAVDLADLTITEASSNTIAISISTPGNAAAIARDVTLNGSVNVNATGGSAVGNLEIERATLSSINVNSSSAGDDARLRIVDSTVASSVNVNTANGNSSLEFEDTDVTGFMNINSFDGTSGMVMTGGSHVGNLNVNTFSGAALAYYSESTVTGTANANSSTGLAEIELVRSTLDANGAVDVGIDGNNARIELFYSMVKNACGNGIENNGTTTIENSTIAGNDDIGIETSGTTDIGFSTIVGNGATTCGGVDSGGLDVEGGAITVRGSIVADNGAANCVGSPITSEGGNVVDDASCALGADDLADTDPLLGPLADNGGETETRLPDAASPAIDFAAGLDCPPDDQRSSERPSGDACDAGSVEVLQTPPTTTPESTTTGAPGTTDELPATGSGAAPWLGALAAALIVAGALLSARAGNSVSRRRAARHAH